ncbi:MAG: TonB-dependent receptor [Ekhidna sp.]
MRRIAYFLFYLSGFLSFCQEEVPLVSYLEKLASTTSYQFYYKEEWVDKITLVENQEPDKIQLIREAVSPFGLKVYIHENTHVFIYPSRVEYNRRLSSANVSSSSQQEEFYRIGDILESDSDSEYELRGRITDEADIPLNGVNVLVDGELRARSDEDGTYALSLKPGNYQLGFSYVGKEKESRLVTFYSSGQLNLSLFEDSEILDEVVVEGSDFGQSSEAVPVGVQKLSIAKLEKMPSFLGDVDVVKSATALPGVTTSGESSSYLNVRGGRNDQTMVLMNNSTIYNPGHMLGFFSVFNGDFVSDMAMYKGNIPARYGMRSSSVLDVKTEKWASDKVNFYGGLGAANSNVGLKTRLLDNKLDLHVGGRISCVDWILNLVPDKDLVQSTAQFGDVNFNSRYRLNDRNSLSYFGYYGGDYFRFSDKIGYKWNTFNHSLKWTHNLKSDWILESELLFSSLSNSTEGLELNDEYIFENGIAERSIKSTISNSKLEAGIDLTEYTIQQGEIEPTTANSLVAEEQLENENLIALSAHGSYLISFDNGLEINPGVRMTYYANRGARTVRQYEEGMPYTPPNVTGTTTYDKGEIYASQNVLEPRIGLAYKHGDNTIRAGYSRINQFLHLISNTVLINPSTVWKGSDQYIPRTVIDQYSVGYEFGFSEQDITISADGFYKNMQNAIDYRDGASLLINDALEQEVLVGDGTAYGVELMLSKGSGKLTGFASYTYSKSFIKVIDELQGVEINDGKRYPFYTDRPHSLNASLDFKLTKKWTLSSNFTYTSGAPISAPIAVYEIEGKTIPLFSERNSERMPDYHRLDIVITVKNRVRKTKKNNDRWVFTFYNVYGRDNVATVFFSSQEDLPGQSFKLVNVGQIVPTITYKFEF